MDGKQIGKIQKISFGKGGYQDVEIGVSFTLGGKAWGVNDFWGTFSDERPEFALWTEENRIKTLGETVMRLNKLLKDAKKRNIVELLNTPIEATFEGNLLKSWRVLTEVI